MTKKEAIAKAEALGLRVSKSASKMEIIGVIEAHERYIRVNEMMARRYDRS